MKKALGTDNAKLQAGLVIQQVNPQTGTDPGFQGLDQS